MKKSGFTLIELSIVLVIIGLIVGGVLVGRDLISAAEIRAQISQMEKYQTAVNTFRAKYNCLPGDCANGTSFGFKARGTSAGQGDGNGLIQSTSYGALTGSSEWLGEGGTFWVDLSQAGLIEGAFNTADETSSVTPVLPVTLTSTPNIDAYLPKAKIGAGNYISLYSVGSVNTNFFAISVITSSTGNFAPGITVQQAYIIDSKVDDGLPESGRVLAGYDNPAGGGPQWVGQGGYYPLPNTFAVLSSGSCSDNGGGSAFPWYSLAPNANSPNCGLSFKFQ